MSGSTVVRLPSFEILMEAHSILEALPDGLLMTDIQGRMTYANARIEQMSGYARSELIGMSVELLLPEGLGSAHGRHERSSTEQTIRSMETGLDTNLLRRDGSELPVQIQLSPAEIGLEQGILAAVRDVQDRRRAEQLLKEHEDALTLLADRELTAIEINAGLIHTLFGIGLHLQGAAKNATDKEAASAMEHAVAELDQAITDVREHLFRRGSDEPPR